MLDVITPPVPPTSNGRTALPGPIRAIIFDLDSVLVDARDWHFEALNRALALYGHAINRADHMSRFDGLPMQHILDVLTAERALSAALHREIVAVTERFADQIIRRRCRPDPTRIATLRRLRALGYRIAVVSNAGRESVDGILRCSGLRPLACLTLSQDDVARAKPDPEIFLTAMRQLDVPAAATLIVESNEYGAIAAHAAGARLLRVDGPDKASFTAIIDAAREPSASFAWQTAVFA